VADFKALISLINEAVEKFNKQVPGIQKQMLDDLQLLVQKLEVKDGKIKIATSNLKILSQIKSRLDKILLSPEYIKSVKGYLGNFNDVVKLQNEYFNSVAKKFTPPKLTAEIKKQAIESVAKSLTENGLHANITDKVRDMMRKAVTGGASYSTLNKQLTDFLINNETGEGQLLRYTKQITTDALNQFSGQYTQIVSADLGFEWFRYSGSNIETTRPFCLACTDRKYFHISQLPKVLKGEFPEFEEREGKLNKKTGLPEGMIAGTDVTNFMTNRGGYNCGHQWRPVSEDLVPQEIKLEVYSSPAYRAWAAAHGKKPVEVPQQKPTVKKQEEKPPVIPAATPTGEKLKAKVIEQNDQELQALKKKDFKLHDDLLAHLGEQISFQKGLPNEAYYSPIGKKIVVGNMGDRMSSQYFKDTLLAHELGHAIHNTKGIIHMGEVSPEYKQHFNGLKKVLKGKEQDLESAFWEKYKGSSNKDKKQLMVIYEILGSLTKGKFGGGHPKSYYQKAGKSEAEIFAHSVSLLKVKNQYEELTPEMKQIIEEMRKFVSNIL